MEEFDCIVRDFLPSKIDGNCTVYYELGDITSSAYIPGFDMAFSFKDIPELERRAKAMLHSFFEFWILGQQRELPDIMKMRKFTPFVNNTFKFPISDIPVEFNNFDNVKTIEIPFEFKLK